MDFKYKQLEQELTALGKVFAELAAHLVARLTGLSIGQLLRCRAHRL